MDIASACEIEGKSGLLLVEAKAHENELSYSGKSSPGVSVNSQGNHQQIGQAIAEANAGLELAAGNPWGISRDSHYQLSNRFAWAWKLASLGVPVVLVYLGFLNALAFPHDFNQRPFEDGEEVTRKCDTTGLTPPGRSVREALEGLTPAA